ncbi:outer membrane protein [Mesorhizobium australicum]|uniref:Opacity protein n=1 Tax=Mesorhizobium australicum TaxID=536018 RepID=A0A1X7PTD4_9HYPH|nr:outer membrane protein [Mesorhizobium australicum]SMH55434.1 Opacity protein [Mesorhizobium australicum]
MRLSLRAALPIVLVGLAPFPAALAADYDPPMVIDTPEEYVPVEVGNGWYLRGDVTYTLNDPSYNFTLFGQTAKIDRFGGGLGVGYQFTDWLRSDVTLNYVGGRRYDYDDGFDAGSAKQQVWSGLVNAYVDLGTYVGVTPYVGAGAGMVYSKHSVNIDPGPPDGVYTSADDQYAFAYALMAGVAYRVSDNISVDLGYQYFSSPSAEYLNADTFSMDKGIDYHQIKLGLRYDLW